MAVAHRGWLPREGFTADLVGAFIKQTALNPAFTLPLILLSHITGRGQDISRNHPTVFKRLKLLLYLGVARLINRTLNQRALNNGVKDTFIWEKEVAVVTGGSDGIGKQVVLLLAEKGIKVAVLDVQPLTYSPPHTVTHHTCDITSSKEIAAAAQAIRDIHGPPTILINNAGVARGKTILSATDSDVRLTFDVNTLSHYTLAREFVPHMVSANHGIVVTVASLAAYVTAPNMVDYAASKAAALAFHEGLAAELVTRYAAPKVRTVLVTQGFTKTPLFQGYASEDRFMMPSLWPQTVAEGIVGGVARGESGHVVLPGSGNLVATNLRSLPYWVQVGLRNQCEKLMKNWDGRQVIDPEERYAGAGKE